jgi:PAS domain-containing protein
MILRLFRASLRQGAEPEVLRRLRTETLPEIRGLTGLHAFTSGFRHDAGRTQHLALSTWTDLAAIEAHAGSLERSVVSTPSHDIFEGVAVDHYELVEPEDIEVVTLEGPVIGVVRAHVARNADASAIDAVRESRPEVTEAGVMALHIGRRVHGYQTELAILAVWRDRASLRRFAARRSGALIRPAFLSQLTEWSFETWDCIDADRLAIPPAGPAVLIADDAGRYVDASPGVESLLGVPGELVLGRTVADLTGPGMRDAFPAAWSTFLGEGRQEGRYTLQIPGGGCVDVQFRAMANVPEPGLHASVVTRPADPADGRSVADITADAFAGASRPAAPVEATPV